MNFELEFEELDQSFDIGFEELHNVSDGGYERGYAAGYEEGSKEHVENIQRLFDKTITEFRYSGLTALPDYGFYQCSKLATVFLPEVTRIGRNAFTQCAALPRVELPKLTTIGNDAFSYCSNLQYADLGQVTSLSSWTFTSCTKLSTLILRRTTLVALPQANAFSSSAIANGTGYIYVADALVDQYKAAAGWAAFASQIKPISELPE